MECFNLNYFMNAYILPSIGSTGPVQSFQSSRRPPGRPVRSDVLLGGSSGSTQGIDPPGKLPLQVRRLVLVNDPLLSQFVDHRGYFRQFFTSFLLYLDLLQIADRITGSFAVIAVTIPALFSLPYIFFCCLVICHELDIFRTAKVRPLAGTTKI